MTLFDRIMNLKYNENSNMTLLKVLIIYHLIIANNFTKHLYSNSLSKFISENKIAQLTISYLTILFITINFGNVTDIVRANLYSGIAFMFFVLSTKLNLEWSLAIFAILIIGYLMESNIIQKINILSTDPSIDPENKDEIKKNNKKHQRVLIITIIAMLLIGVIVYGVSKHEKFQNNFDIGEFVIGKDRRFRFVKN